MNTAAISLEWWQAAILAAIAVIGPRALEWGRACFQWVRWRVDRKHMVFSQSTSVTASKGAMIDDRLGEIAPMCPQCWVGKRRQTVLSWEYLHQGKGLRCDQCGWNRMQRSDIPS